MKKLLSIGALAACLFLAGCDSPEEIAAHNSYSLQHPQIVGKTEDGREIKMYAIRNASSYTHYIYIVEGKSSISENHLEGGKTKYTVTNATVY